MVTEWCFFFGSGWPSRGLLWDGSTSEAREEDGHTVGPYQSNQRGKKDAARRAEVSHKSWSSHEYESRFSRHWGVFFSSWKIDDQTSRRLRRSLPPPLKNESKIQTDRHYNSTREVDNIMRADRPAGYYAREPQVLSIQILDIRSEDMPCTYDVCVNLGKWRRSMKKDGEKNEKKIGSYHTYNQTFNFYIAPTVRKLYDKQSYHSSTKTLSPTL